MVTCATGTGAGSMAMVFLTPTSKHSRCSTDVVRASGCDISQCSPHRKRCKIAGRVLSLQDSSACCVGWNSFRVSSSRAVLGINLNSHHHADASRCTWVISKAQLGRESGVFSGKHLSVCLGSSASYIGCADGFFRVVRSLEGDRPSAAWRWHRHALIPHASIASDSNRHHWPPGLFEEDSRKIATSQHLSPATMQEVYGTSGVKFESSFGVNAVSLRVKGGSQALVLVEGARVVSWKMAMWHGGQEEALKCTSRPVQSSVPGEKKMEVRDGLAAELEGTREATDQAGPSPYPDLLNQRWGVAAASTSADGARSQVVLGLDPSLSETPSSPLALRVSITLQEDELDYAFYIRNMHTESAIAVVPSIASALAISDPEGIELGGLTGARFAVGSGGEAARKPPSAGDAFVEGLAGVLGRLMGSDEPQTEAAREEEATGSMEDGVRWETERNRDVIGPLNRRYKGLKGPMVLTDRGHRRMLIAQPSTWDELALLTKNKEARMNQKTSSLNMACQMAHGVVVLDPGKCWSGSLKLSNPSV